MCLVIVTLITNYYVPLVKTNVVTQPNPVSAQALKTKHDTPKYGLIYHAQLVGQAGTKLKGKVGSCLYHCCL